MSARLCALRRATGFLGIAEQPPGSNRGPLIDQWLRGAGAIPGEPWCMAFQHALFRLCGVTLGGWASVGSFELWARQHGYEIVRPFRGDLACFEWANDDWPDHVGLVERVLALPWFGGRGRYLLRTIEGNSGDAVRRRYRAVPRAGPGSARFVRVPG